MKFKTRKWQNHAFNIIDNCVKSNVRNIVPVNACVGSGKTAVACYSFGKFISEHRDENTVQIFVTPRIRLCDQQNKEIENFLFDYFGLVAKTDFSIISVDCTKNEYDKHNDALISKHSIFVICADSLWGTEAKNQDPDYRWHNWIHKFKVWSEKGYKFGFAAFDESHNYADKVHKLYFSDNTTIKTTVKNLNDYFNIILMSGTPAAFQRELSKKYADLVCKCPPKVAIQSNWICKPTLNLVKCGSVAFPGAIVSVLHREINICKDEVFMPRIMINFTSIDEIKAFTTIDWFKNNVGKEFHFVTLHSNKGLLAEDGCKIDVKPTIDGIEVDADEAYKSIENIDSNEYFKDDMPILVAQVRMLSEGINVNSFNSIITTSNSEKTAMQQIGRCVRNYRFKEKEKVFDGHANVYVLFDNKDSVVTLVKNLKLFDLTDECFSWGDAIDISTGSSPDIISESFATYKDIVWEAIDESTDIEIINIFAEIDKEIGKRRQYEAISKLLTVDYNGDGQPDINELVKMIKDLNKNKRIEIYAQSRNNPMKLKKLFNLSTDEIKNGVISTFEKQSVKVKGNKEENAENSIDAAKKSEAADSGDLVIEQFNEWITLAHDALKNSYYKNVWQKDRYCFLLRVFDIPEVAKFFDEHMTEELENFIVGKRNFNLNLDIMKS